MNVRRKLSQSSAARVFAFPTRAKAAASHAGRESWLATKWLLTSREHHNYTYDLSQRNLSHLAWWVSSITGKSPTECLVWIEEALNDEVLRAHVQISTQFSTRRGLADDEVRIGRRAGWYAVVRALRPNHVVETGTDKGLGSIVLAAALLKNGQGRLTTIDINPEAGYLVSGPYGSVTNLIIGDSLSAIEQLEPDVDLFIHDSDHIPGHETRELVSISMKLNAGGLVLSDNSHAADSLLEWAAATDRQFSFFQERPDRHWYQGAGIGAAW